jgi:DMSO/TMAO reductase YedYZ heme-binding membrane subunit
MSSLNPRRSVRRRPHRRAATPIAVRRPPSRYPLPRVLPTAALLLLPLLALLGGDGLRAALDFTTGVLTLVTLTAAVAWGLLATDRLLLRPRHRLIAQGVHRITAAASLGFLLLHLTIKVALGHVSLISALLPFAGGLSGTGVLVGFGSLAGLLMVVAATTGALRSVFATPGRVPGRWRALHMLAYPAWCSALLHGLFAGRPAAAWVVTTYALCLAGVASALSLRLLPARLKRGIVENTLSPRLPSVPRQRLPLAPPSDTAASTPRHAHAPTGERR